MGSKRLIIGHKFFRLTVVDLVRRDEYGRSYLLCKCDCGQSKIVRMDALGKSIKSCGCLNKEWHIEHGKTMNLKHGLWGIPEYRSWHHMKQRCFNNKVDCWKNYGGRGISVCERWIEFENFFKDMGKRPEGTSLDRIDNDGNYEPGNCKWSTPKEQLSNRVRKLI